MLHSGIDLHKRTIALSTVTADGQPVRDAQPPTTRAAVRAYFDALPGPHRAVVESTSNWYWLRDPLAGAGVALRLGRSKYIKAISDAGRAPCAAAQPAAGEDRRRGRRHPRAAAPERPGPGGARVGEALVSAEWRAARDLPRARLQLVAQQVRCKNTVAGLLARREGTRADRVPPASPARARPLAPELSNGVRPTA